MKLKCSNCSFELNLPIKTLPKNAKLYCPKCKNILSPIEEVQGQEPVPQTPSVTNTFPPTISPENRDEARPQIQVAPPPIPSINAIPPQESRAELFSEDIKPELEINQEEVFKKREELFAKPEQVWYDGSQAPPPIPSVQNITPPPIPANVPPPIPLNTPPPIPQVSQAPRQGYISASSSIQIDSSLIMPDVPPPAQVPVTPAQTPVIREEEKIELETESITPPKEETKPPVEEKEKEPVKSDKKDVIILTPQAYTGKKISLTIPAISLIILAALAGFIYYQIIVSSSKSDLIKDLKTTPSLGTIPAIKKGENQTEGSSQDATKESKEASTKSLTKIPIKAKKSALEHYKKGNQYYMQSKYEQARDEYAMAIAADPTFGLAYRGLGTTYAKLGQPDLAVKNYEKYIELMPNATDAEQVKNIIKQYYGK